jgi:hypothetical protein
LQHADGNSDVDQSLRDGVECRNGIAHVLGLYHPRGPILERDGRAVLFTLLSW